VSWEDRLQWDPPPTSDAVLEAMRQEGVRRITSHDNMGLVMRGVDITPEQIEAAGIEIDIGTGELIE